MSARTHRSTRTHHAIAALLAALLAVATMALTTSRAEADVVSRSWTFSSRSQVADWQANARLSRAGGSLQLANRHARARTLVMSSRHAVRPVTHRATYRLSTAVRATKPGQRVKLAVIERDKQER